MLLFLLLPSESTQTVFWPLSHVSALLPELSREGQRSLLFWLKRQGLIDQVLKQGRPSIFLTQAGREVLEKELPLFTLGAAWQGNWQVLIFRQAPAFDPRFTALRAKLLKSGSLVLSRGVYAFPGQVPTKIAVECQERYSESVFVIETNEWVLGDVREAAITQFGLTDLSQLYSSVSTELSSLLAVVSGKNKLDHQIKNQIYSLYARFFANLCGDTGLVRFYFPFTPSWREILGDFHRLLNL